MSKKYVGRADFLAFHHSIKHMNYVKYFTFPSSFLSLPFLRVRGRVLTSMEVPWASTSLSRSPVVIGLIGFAIGATDF